MGGKAKRKGGRKRMAGERYKSGDLKPRHDQGNEKIVALMSVFRPFQGGKADQWVKESAIGRAWAVGLLDGFGVDAAAIRDAGLGYAARYWGYYPSASGCSSYGDDKRGRGWGDDEDPRGVVFQRLDNAIRSAGSAAHAAALELVVDGYWFPQEDPAWLGRLINDALAGKGRGVAGELSRRGDVERLRLAVSGLLTIVQGVRRAA